MSLTADLVEVEMRNKGYWKVRALYYEALYRIASAGNKSDPFMLDDIGYPAYFMPTVERIDKSEGRFRGVSELCSLFALPE